jgi:hypothetical protein
MAKQGLPRSTQIYPRVTPRRLGCVADREYRAKVRDAVLKTMDRLKLDAFFYPTWTNPPRLIGDLNTPHGGNSPFLLADDRLSGDQHPYGLFTRRRLLEQRIVASSVPPMPHGTGIIYFAMNGWCYFQVPNGRTLSRDGAGRLPSRQQSERERSPERFRIL